MTQDSMRVGREDCTDGRIIVELEPYRRASGARKRDEHRLNRDPLSEIWFGGCMSRGGEM